MRAIKFRAWDIEDKEMLYAEDCLLKLNFMGEIFQRSAGEVTSHFILMQFTGLKDKNGKEIYEGDIVRGIKTYIGVTSTGTGIIIFKDAGFVYSPLNKSSEKHIHFWDEKEVIGNIYEHPELLNDTKVLI